MLTVHSHAIHPQNKDRTGWLDKYVEEYEHDADYIAEGLALRLVEQAISIMGEKGISRSDLASLMGVSRSHITRMFNAPPNLTLRSVAQLAGALGVKAELKFTLPSSATREESAAATQKDEEVSSTISEIPTGEGRHPKSMRKRKDKLVDSRRPVRDLKVSDEYYEATVELAESVALTSQEILLAETVLAMSVDTFYSCLLSRDLDSLREALKSYGVDVREHVLLADLNARGIIPAGGSDGEEQS